MLLRLSPCSLRCMEAVGLAEPLRVPVRGVDGVHPGLESGVEHPPSLGVVRGDFLHEALGVSEGHRAETERGDPQSASAQLSLFHCGETSAPGYAFTTPACATKGSRWRRCHRDPRRSSRTTRCPSPGG